MPTRVVALVICLATGIGTIVYIGTNIAIAIGTSLVAASIALIADIISHLIYDQSIVGRFIIWRHVKTYSDNEAAFQDIVAKYQNGSTIQSVVLIGYTGDMQSRDLQRFLGSKKIKVQELKVLVKHPNTIGTSFALTQNTVFPRLPDINHQSQKRKNEIDHTISEIKSLYTSGLIENYEIRGYYSIPTSRAVVINKEIGFFSLYGKHDIGNDMSGSTSVFVRISNKTRTEKSLLEMVIDWYQMCWRLSVKIDQN